MPKCKFCQTPLNSKIISNKIAKYIFEKDLMIKCAYCGRQYRIDIEFHFVLSLFISVLFGYSVYAGINSWFPHNTSFYMPLPSFAGSLLLFYLLGVNGSMIATVEEYKGREKRKIS